LRAPRSRRPSSEMVVAAFEDGDIPAG
jgi:hypothetical protein